MSSDPDPGNIVSSSTSYSDDSLDLSSTSFLGNELISNYNLDHLNLQILVQWYEIIISFRLEA